MQLHHKNYMPKIIRLELTSSWKFAEAINALIKIMPTNNYVNFVVLFATNS
jgi:hypothetical protein